MGCIGARLFRASAWRRRGGRGCGIWFLIFCDWNSWSSLYSPLGSVLLSLFAFLVNSAGIQLYRGVVQICMCEFKSTGFINFIFRVSLKAEGYWASSPKDESM